MQLELSVFKFPDGNHFENIRTVEINGEPWFVAADVAKVLGYAKPSNAVQSHCK